MGNTTTIHDGGAEYSADSAAPSDDDTRVHRLGSAATTYDRSAEYSADSAPPTGDCFSVYRQSGVATTNDYSAAPAADEPGIPSEIRQLATSLREMGQDIAQGSHQNINHLTQATADQARILGHEIQEMVDTTLSDQHQPYLDSTKRVEQNIGIINDQYLGATQRQGRRIDQVSGLIAATEKNLEERMERIQRDIQAHGQTVARVQRLAQQQTETRPSTIAQKKAPATANYVPRRRPQTTSQTGPNPNPPTGTAPSQPAKAVPPQATHQAIPNGQLRRNPSIEPQSTPEAPPAPEPTRAEEHLPPLTGEELWRGTERVRKMTGTFTPKEAAHDGGRRNRHEDFLSFAKRFQYMAKFYEIPKANWAQMFATCLAASAHEEYLAMSEEQQNDYEQTIAHLGKIYPAPTRKEWTYRIEWDALRQGQYEQLQDFIGRIESLAHKSHPSLNTRGLEFEKIMKFRHGIASSFLRYDLAIVTAETLQELGERAITIQLKRNADPATMWARTTEASDVARDLGTTPMGIARTAQFEPQQPPMVEVTRLPYAYPDTMPPATTRVTYVPAPSFTVPATPPPPTPSYNPPTQPPPGHPQESEQRRQQPKDEGYPKKRREDYQRGMDLASIRCYNCGELGHLANKCSRPDKRLQRNYRGGNRGRGSRGGNRANSYTDNRQSSDAAAPPTPTPEPRSVPPTEQSPTTQNPTGRQYRAQGVPTNADPDPSTDDVGFDLLMSSDPRRAMIRFAGADVVSSRSESLAIHTQTLTTGEDVEQFKKLAAKLENTAPAPPVAVPEVPKPFGTSAVYDDMYPFDKSTIGSKVMWAKNWTKPPAMPQKPAKESKVKETPKECDWLQEVSIALHAVQCVNVAKHRKQRFDITHYQRFHQSLVGTFLLPGTDGRRSPGHADYGAHLALDVLLWLGSNAKLRYSGKKGSMIGRSRIIGSSRVVTNSSLGSSRPVDGIRIEGLTTPTSTRRVQNHRLESRTMESKNVQNAIYNAQRPKSAKTTASTGANADGLQAYSLQRQRSMCCDDSSIVDQSSRDRQVGRVNNSSNYELSEDLVLRQVAMIERKYGLRARRAAIVIQRAYRRYCLERQFRVIRRITSRYACDNVGRMTDNKWQGSSVYDLTPRPPRLLSSHNSQPHDIARRRNYERIEDLIKDKSKIVYQISDSEIFGEPNRPKLSARSAGNHSSLTSANRIRSKSTERYDPNRRISHVNTSQRHAIKIISDRADILGDARKSTEPAAVVAKIQPYRDDPYAPRMNLARLQLNPASSADPSLSTLSTENLDQKPDGNYVLMSAPVNPAEGAASPVWKRVTTPHAKPGRRDSGSPGRAKGRIAFSNLTRCSDGSTPLSVTPSSEFAQAVVQSPVDSTYDVVAYDQTPSTPTQPPLGHTLFRNPSIRHAVPVKPTETELKRRYRIGLNFFNKKPDRGIELLINLGLVEPKPEAVARSLLTRKGLSRQMIGELLGSLQQPFNMAVLRTFANAVDVSNMEVDMALRKFQSFFRLPGEAQKIERIMQVFADRYCECNPDSSRRFRNRDTAFVLAFAIIMLNTDLHSPNLKPERRMKLDEFVKNLKFIDEGQDMNADLLAGIYSRVKQAKFRPGHDHVAQVIKVDKNPVSKKPQLAVPHRRLVCYCRLYEALDPHKRQASTAHQREIFLFNDMILITKILSKKKSGVTYAYRESHSLVGMQAHALKPAYFENGIRIAHTLENKVILFNARNDEDKVKFLEDLRESILESDEMEALRIELALEKQKWCLLPCANNRVGNSLHRPGTDNRDSGLADDTDHASGSTDQGQATSPSGSLVNLRPADNAEAARPRRNSVNSLDGGMNSAATGSLSWDFPLGEYAPKRGSTSSTSAADGDSGHSRMERKKKKAHVNPFKTTAGTEFQAPNPLTPRVAAASQSKQEVKPPIQENTVSTSQLVPHDSDDDDSPPQTPVAKTEISAKRDDLPDAPTSSSKKESQREGATPSSSVEKGAHRRVENGADKGPQKRTSSEISSNRSSKVEERRSVSSPALKRLKVEGSPVIPARVSQNKQQRRSRSRSRSGSRVSPDSSKRWNSRADEGHEKRKRRHREREDGRSPDDERRYRSDEKKHRLDSDRDERRDVKHHHRDRRHSEDNRHRSEHRQHSGSDRDHHDSHSRHSRDESRERNHSHHHHEDRRRRSRETSRSRSPDRHEANGKVHRNDKKENATAAEKDDEPLDKETLKALKRKKKRSKLKERKRKEHEDDVADEIPRASTFGSITSSNDDKNERRRKKKEKKRKYRNGNSDSEATAVAWHKHFHEKPAHEDDDVRGHRQHDRGRQRRHEQSRPTEKESGKAYGPKAEVCSLIAAPESDTHAIPQQKQSERPPAPTASCVVGQ